MSLLAFPVSDITLLPMRFNFLLLSSTGYCNASEHMETLTMVSSQTCIKPVQTVHMKMAHTGKVDCLYLPPLLGEAFLGPFPSSNLILVRKLYKIILQSPDMGESIPKGLAIRHQLYHVLHWKVLGRHKLIWSIFLAFVFLSWIWSNHPADPGASWEFNGFKQYHAVSRMYCFFCVFSLPSGIGHSSLLIYICNSNKTMKHNSLSCLFDI